MFIRHQSVHQYRLVPKREFYDQECPFKEHELAAILSVQEDFERLNAYLSQVYAVLRQGGKNVPEVPEWLVRKANEKAEFDAELEAATAANKRRPQATEAPSSTKSRGRPRKSASSSSTSPETE